jgi:predicted GNAT family acetyltransferase
MVMSVQITINLSEAEYKALLIQVESPEQTIQELVNVRASKAIEEVGMMEIVRRRQLGEMYNFNKEQAVLDCNFKTAVERKQEAGAFLIP